MRVRFFEALNEARDYLTLLRCHCCFANEALPFLTFVPVHRERVLFVQASNCVERAEWVRLLSALCRSSPAPPHRGFYADTQWTW